MNNSELIGRHQAALTLNYGKLPVALVRGEGSRLWDAEGKEYIDMFAGFGGTILGHTHPVLVEAISKQAHTLWATGNQFYTEPQIRLAERLKAQAFDGRAFFCHSGAEAKQAATPLARRAGGEGRFKLISMARGIHGRTLGALSATPTPEYQKGFYPLVPGFVSVPYNDLAALEKAIDKETCAVLVEPIQGEGGINMPAEGYLRGVRELCTRNNLSMIVDEVWTGVGRTGRYFGHQYAGITPDIMTLGKALGGGVPVGCMFAEPGRAALLKPGTHGCTLGGNPVCAAVGGGGAGDGGAGQFVWGGGETRGDRGGARSEFQECGGEDQGSARPRADAGRGTGGGGWLAGGESRAGERVDHQCDAEECAAAESGVDDDGADAASGVGSTGTIHLRVADRRALADPDWGWSGALVMHPCLSDILMQPSPLSVPKRTLNNEVPEVLEARGDTPD